MIKRLQRLLLRHRKYQNALNYGVMLKSVLRHLALRTSPRAWAPGDQRVSLAPGATSSVVARRQQPHQLHVDAPRRQEILDDGEEADPRVVDVLDDDVSSRLAVVDSEGQHVQVGHVGVQPVVDDDVERLGAEGGVPCSIFMEITAFS